MEGIADCDRGDTGLDLLVRIVVGCDVDVDDGTPLVALFDVAVKARATLMSSMVNGIVN